MAGIGARASVPATRWPAPRAAPRTYPGVAPDYPYLLLADRVHPLVVRLSRGLLRVTLTDGTPVDDVLRRVGATPLGRRVPAIAYGANRSPASLALKLAHHGAARGRGATAVPVLAGWLADVDTVGASLSPQGFVRADLVDSPDTTIDVLLALLDLDQLVAIHDSEQVGRLYDCAWRDDFHVAGPPGAQGTLGGLAYVGRRPIFHVTRPEGDGARHPLAFSAITARGRRLPAVTQIAILARAVEATPEIDELRGLLGTRPDAPPTAVAEELSRLLNGQWWRRHDTGDAPTAVATRAGHLVSTAMDAQGVLRSPASPLVTSRIDAAEDTVPGADRTLGDQVEIA